jgi:hypothetical protein
MITLDNILNEYFKNSSLSLVRVLYRISNLILDTGIIPENWTLDMNKLVYKDKGNSTDLDNFSAITEFTKLHMGLVVLGKKMSVLINFLLQNTKLVSVLSKIGPNFAGHDWQD